MGKGVTDLLDVLALKIGDELLQTLLVSVNANRLKDALDVSGRGGGVAGKAEQEVSGEVLHFGGFYAGRRSVSWSRKILDCRAELDLYRSRRKERMDSLHRVNLANRRINRFNRELGGD